ncbi:MAG: response regulator, partial [Gammaproteobacteria bacterium]|nr:response regulator [Gammaproteobacteria bacterium]
SGVPGEIFLLGEREGVLLYHSGPSLGQSLFRSTLSNELKNHILSGGKDTELYVGSGGHVWVISHTPLRVEGVAWFITTVMEISAVIAPRLGGESGGDDYLTQVITQYGYDDMMMVDPNGDVFYSANQGEEYLSNIFQGVFEGSHLAELVQKVQQTLNYAISDFSPYVGHGLQPAAFAAIPVEIVHRGDDYRRSFVIVLELSLDLINEVMIARTGMGESGESYLVGEDLLLRSDAFNGEGDFTVSSSFETPQSRSINTIPAQRAVAGEHGAMFTSSYDGRSVISSFEAIDLESFHWGLLVEVAEDEALQVVSELNRLSLIVLTVVAVLIILLSRWIASGISRPIIKTSDLMKRVAETGDFSERLPILQQDEIGQMAESMNRLLIHLQSAFFRLKTVYDASNEGILIVANDGRVLDANRRFSKIWELPEPIVEQHAVQELIRMMMSRLKGSQEFLRTTEATIGSVESKASALLAFNDGRMVTCHSRPHWVHDQVEGRIWNFYDVTEEWSAIHAKDDFLASMSHELRTPLTAIIGNCELLSEMETDPDKRQLIRAIDVSGRGQLALVNDILDLSKIESGKFTIDESPYDLNLLVQDILQMFSTRVEDAGLWFELEQPRTFPHPLVGDKHRIAQVLINLIGNAIKFTQQGHITLKVWRADTQLCFSVEDSGIGMSAEIIGRLFQRFEQADSSTSRRFGGSGLGLYISKGLTDLMGGTIEVESEVKVGSKFLLRLPYTEGAPVLSQEDKQEGEKEKRGASLKGAILVAEDTPELQLLVRRILESMGVSVAVADNGKEAVELATAQSFDLILMDMQMPVMDGIEATKMLRSQGSS